MLESEASEIKGKIVGGVFALTTRTFILQIISFFSIFLLTILLTPSVFGVYFVVSAIISFLAYFSDIGLAAALIQKKTEPTDEDIISTFTIQQILIGLIVTISFAFSGSIIDFYNLDESSLFLFRALIVSFFLSSLKTIPSILLERKLDFQKLIIPQILETSAFYLVTIVLAWKGLGIASFAWGALVRGLVGLLVIYYISPWRVRFGISKKSLKHLLSYGLPFQAHSILALVKDDLMTIFLGKILSFNQIGYIGWAKKWAEVPLRLIMDSVMRVTFPAYSRLAADKKLMGKAMEKSLFFLGLFIFPSTAILIIMISPLIHIIPRYIKWEQALSSFYLFTISSLFAAFSTPMVNALNALGKIKISLFLMVIWTFLTWILIPAFVRKVGYNGVAIAALLISSTSFLPFVLIRRYVVFKVFMPVIKPLLASIFMSVPMVILINSISNFPMAVFSLITGMVVYSLIIWIFMRNEILPYLPNYLKKRLV